MSDSTQETSDLTALVTGSTDGIGRQIALGLARKGATVVVHGRSREKGESVINQIERETDGSAVLLLADFTNTDAIVGLASAVTERYNHLDVLINNAATSSKARVETKDGVERTFAINYLAPFLLTHQLLPLLRESDHARIITTSSGLHRQSSIQFDDLQSNENYDGMEAYGRSKLANVFFTYELARRLDPASITANVFGPGFVPGTRLDREASFWFQLATGSLSKLPNFLLRALPDPIHSAKQAARTPVYLATNPDVKYVSGQYFENQKPVLSAPHSYDPGRAHQLWEMSADLLDVSGDHFL